MLIEKELEAKVVSALEALDGLKDMEIVGARQESSTGIVKGETETSMKGVVAVSVGFRTHDNFSLTPISVPVTIAISTRSEMDATGLTHEMALETIADKLSHWHRYGDAMTEDLSCARFFAGELRMDGGSGKQFDSTRSAWVESVNFTIRGAERFGG